MYTLHSWRILPIADSLKLLELELLELSHMSMSLCNSEKIPAHKNENEDFNPPLTSMIASDASFADAYLSPQSCNSLAGLLHMFFPHVFHVQTDNCQLESQYFLKIHICNWLPHCCYYADSTSHHFSDKKEQKGNVRYCSFPTLTGKSKNWSFTCAHTHKTGLRS